jgi:hypothetical protein
MFSVLTAITLTVGSVSSTMVMSEQDRLAAEEARPAVVEILVPQVQPATVDQDSSTRYL